MSLVIASSEGSCTECSLDVPSLLHIPLGDQLITALPLAPPSTVCKILGWLVALGVFHPLNTRVFNTRVFDAFKNKQTNKQLNK